MPEHDAFGREIGDRPAAPAGPEPEAATVAPVDAPPAARRPAPAPRPVRRRRRGRGLVLVALLVVAAGVAPAVMRVGEQLDDLVPAPVVPDVEAAAPPRGLGERSLLRRAGFERALDALRSAGLGRPLTIRAAPDRIDATLADGRRLSHAQVTPAGELRRFGASRGGTAVRPLRWGAIDPGAPERLVRRAAARIDRPVRRIDYLVLTATPSAGWNAYFKGGRVVLGDRRGRPTRVL